MSDLSAPPVKGSSSYLGAGHQMSMVKSGSGFKGWCSAQDWSAIGTTKGEVRDRWSQHLYGVMQKRGEGARTDPPVGPAPSPHQEPEIVPE